MNTTTRKELLEVCRLVYERYLTNAAGSNFSARASETLFYLTPTGNAKRNRLRMSPDELLLLDLEGNILEGKGKHSSSWSTHSILYREFEYVGAVIHAHPKMATVFSCQEKPMTPMLDAMKKYGEIHVLPRHFVVDSMEFGQAIVEHFKQNKTSLKKHGHAVIYPYHGVLVAAPTLDDAFDLLERMEFNATAILYQRLILS
jgi:L-fuculose-phosphate aldolase